METSQPPIADSPWFWLYLFAMCALAGGLVMAPKYGARQATLEKQYQARQRAEQIRQGDTPQGAISSADDTLIDLRPLYLVLLVLVSVGWARLWWTRWGSRGDTTINQTPREGTST
ncbi:hypothetical protein [Blastopirellula retiformator]|uniref:Uncharacterized protein n=1 Tax=Blastopirellula retiformator TaxID=2527970 RepID=A0A5C5V1F3_9BACT|nr:hypothetical protein [Blastopirellula retiformator]TWT31525.1 hypothetical protein Enr8_34470 [Blastopirellula retiformator]